MMLIGLLVIPLAAAGLIALTRQRALMELLHTLAGIATSLLGAAVVAWQGEHLRMDILVRRFPAAMKVVIRIVEAISIIAIVGFALWQSVRYVQSMLRLGANSPTAQIPMWLPHSGVVAGLALILAVALWRLARGER